MKTTCIAGQYMVSNGDALTDRSCAACADGYSIGSNQPACTAWTDCQPGEFVAQEGVAAADRVCEPCALGTTTTGVNQGACEPGCAPGGPNTFTDPRDCKVYPTAPVGAVVWFARNLDYSAGGSLCMNDDPTTCEVYGRLYDWPLAMSVCPSGTRIATEAEWQALDVAPGQGSVVQLQAGPGYFAAWLGGVWQPQSYGYFWAEQSPGVGTYFFTSDGIDVSTYGGAVYGTADGYSVRCVLSGG